ncbi:MAG: DNA-3-methyladenine glycosylase [Ginsengibacter sp.]
MRKLSKKFYERDDVVLIAKELIGKILVSNIGGETTSGRIVETEAYVAHIDKASHAYSGKRTLRNEHMYSDAGTSYVYICYGTHQMFNVVTNKKEVPDAVLVRAVEPLSGLDLMLKRCGKKDADFTITKGPGNVGKALGIKKIHSGLDLLSDNIFIADDGFKIEDHEIASGPRIGVESAGKDALLAYRFYIRGNKYVSRKNT